LSFTILMKISPLTLMHGDIFEDWDMIKIIWARERFGHSPACNVFFYFIGFQSDPTIVIKVKASRH
jgi:hypothetical protein